MARRRILTRRPTSYTPSNHIELEEPISEEDLLHLLSNPRNGFCSQDKNKVLVSLDYSGQEARIAAVLSQDPAMVTAHLAPSKLKRADGTEYVNPAADLHLLSSATCTHPHLIEGIPEDKWYEILTEVQPGAKVKPRNVGKVLNFSMLYLSSAKSISERNHVKLADAEQWVKNHQTTYSGYYEWAEEYGNIAASRGFARIPYSHSLRWVLEERSGGRDGDSAVRSSVNAAIQSTAAVQTKQSMVLIQNLIDEGGLPDAEIVGQCHDEILMYLPGTAEIDWEECDIKDGLIKELAFSHSDQAEKYTLNVLKIMEDVQTKMFRDLGSAIKGACSYSIAPVWAH